MPSNSLLFLISCSSSLPCLPPLLLPFCFAQLAALLSMEFLLCYLLYCPIQIRDPSSAGLTDYLKLSRLVRRRSCRRVFGESAAEVGWLVVQEKRGKGCSPPSCGLQMHLLFCPPSTNFYAARIIGKEKFNCHCQGGGLLLKTNTPSLREVCGKSKWKFKMAFAMKGGGVSRGLVCH